MISYKMLELNNITKIFNAGTVDETTLFDNFSFKLDKGEFAAVIGSNGSGKTFKGVGNKFPKRLFTVIRRRPTQTEQVSPLKGCYKPCLSIRCARDMYRT